MITMTISKCNSATEEPPSKQKREAVTSPSSWLSPLPDEVALSCLVRVSKLDHPALSSVSKSYRSLVASRELYDLRSAMGHTEELLYVCLRTPPHPTPRWFVVRRDAKTSLVEIPSLPSMPWEASSVVVVDWGIYVMGGIANGKPTSDVWLLDCRSHTWRQLSCMRVARAWANTGMIDGKIYVLGGCEDNHSSNWAEVFDTKTQTWDTLSVPNDPYIRFFGLIGETVVIDDKIYGLNLSGRTIYYMPREDKWGKGSVDSGGEKRCWCVVDKLLYCCHSDGTIMWCEPEELEMGTKIRTMFWKEVKGLESLRKTLSRSRLVNYMWEDEVNNQGLGLMLEEDLPGVKLASSSGNLVLFWDVLVRGVQSLEIWCAEISLERHTGGNLLGTILRCNPVMKLNPFLSRFKVLHSLAVKV